jgi:hypothetical protein
MLSVISIIIVISCTNNSLSSSKCNLINGGKQKIEQSLFQCSLTMICKFNSKFSMLRTMHKIGAQLEKGKN